MTSKKISISSIEMHFDSQWYGNTLGPAILFCRGSVLCSVIKATGKAKLEDGLRIGNQFEAENSFAFYLIPGVGWTRFLQGRRKSKLLNSA